MLLYQRTLLRMKDQRQRSRCRLGSSSSNRHALSDSSGDRKESGGKGEREPTATAKEAAAAAANKCRTLGRQAFRAALMTVTYAHVSELVPTHDTICGAAGLITSVMDVKDMWPKKIPS